LYVVTKVATTAYHRTLCNKLVILKKRKKKQNSILFLKQFLKEEFNLINSSNNNNNNNKFKDDNNKYYTLLDTLSLIDSDKCYNIRSIANQFRVNKYNQRTSI